MGAVPERAYRAWLSETVSDRDFRRLLLRCGSAKEVFEQASSGQSEIHLSFLTGEKRLALKKQAHLAALESCWQNLQQNRIAVVLPDDPAYPPALSDLFEPPLILYMRGRKETLLRSNRLCIVGNREASAYGRQMSARFAEQWAAVGGCVVSGLAPGVDSSAHAAALSAGDFSTIAVLTGGLSSPDRRGDLALFEQISEKGLLLSENPPNYRFNRGSIPHRNRIMAGLCQAVLLVEARQKSGTQHTVSAALDLGREVFAVPGPLDAPGSELPNALIRDGAAVATELVDLLSAYPQMSDALQKAAQDKIKEANKKEINKKETANKERNVAEKETAKQKVQPICPKVAPNTADYSAEEAKILQALGEGDRSLEELATACQLPVPVLLVTVSKLMAISMIEMDASALHYRLV